MKKLLLGLTLLSSVSASAVTCREGSICKDDRVNFGGYVGTVVEVFSDATVKIAVDDYEYDLIRSTFDLGKGVECYGGGSSFNVEVCEGDRVEYFIRTYSFTGVVEEVFTNSNVKVKLDDDDYGYGYVDLGKINIIAK